MNNNTRIEDVTLNLTTSTSGVNLIGIYFTGSSTISAKLRVCILNIFSTASGAGYVYGVYSDGTTTNPTTLLSTNAIQRTTINVNSSTSGMARSLYVNGPCQFAVRDSVYFAGYTGATSGTNIIGVEVGNTGAFVSLKTSTVSGITGDIKQPALGLTGYNPVLQLTATDLINANSINGFGTNIQSNQITYIVTGSINNPGGSGYYYLTPGNITGSSLNTSYVYSLPFSQKTILYSAMIYNSVAFTGPHYIIVKVYNTTNPAILGTLIFTTTLNPTNSNPIRIQNFASSFNPSTINYLQVTIIPNDLNGATHNNNALFITLSFY